MTLTVVETIRGTLASKKAKKRKTTQRTVIVGHKTISLRAGQTKTVRVPLDTTGERLLNARKTLQVRLTGIQNGLPLYSSIVALAHAAQARKKH